MAATKVAASPLDEMLNGPGVAEVPLISPMRLTPFLALLLQPDLHRKTDLQSQLGHSRRVQIIALRDYRFAVRAHSARLRREWGEQVLHSGCKILADCRARKEFPISITN
jgi:hypothetical protein